MKNERENQSKSLENRGNLHTHILCQFIQTNKRMYVALMSQYTKDPIQQDEILSDVMFNFTKMTTEKFETIGNMKAYTMAMVKNETLNYLKNLGKRQLDNLDDHADSLWIEDFTELQQGEILDILIDKHRIIKDAVSLEDFDLLQRWGVHKQSYKQMMAELGLTDAQVRMKIYHLRKFIKSKFKKFW